MEEKKEINSESKSQMPNQDIRYKEVHKKPFLATIKDSIPPETVPTKKTGYIFTGIIIFVLIWGIGGFFMGSGMSKMLQGEMDVNISVGIPWDMIKLELANPASVPFRVWGILGDLLIFAIIAYGLDVLINLISKTSLIESKEDKMKHPEMYEIKNENPNPIENKVVESNQKSTNGNQDKEKIKPKEIKGDPEEDHSKFQRPSNNSTVEELTPPKN